MKVMTVCRMNQARSPFAEAALKSYFPELELSSAGVFARRDSLYLDAVVEIARRWGIPMRDGYSRELANNSELATTDLVICAEQSMREAVLAQNYEGEVVAFEEVVPDPSFMPRDPELMRGRQLESELAKVAWINLHCVNESFGYSGTHQVSALVPETESNMAAAISLAVTSSKSTGALIVDADLRVPIAREFRKLGLRVGKLGSDQAAEEWDVLSNLTEGDLPERRFISAQWSQLISGLAHNRPVIMVTAPQETEVGPLPDSYLAVIPASRIEIVRN